VWGRSPRTRRWPVRARRLGAVVVVALPLSLVLTGCMLPGAMAVSDRLPSCHRPTGCGPWMPVVPQDLAGSFESVEICGDIAACVLQITYRFEPGGGYQGEALLLFESGPATRQISGTWKLAAGRLHLGNGSEPAEISTDGSRLRLTTALGTVTLRRTD